MLRSQAVGHGNDDATRSVGQRAKQSVVRVEVAGCESSPVEVNQDGQIVSGAGGIDSNGDPSCRPGNLAVLHLEDIFWSASKL